MSEWQPIETSLKTPDIWNGERHILILTTCHGAVEAWFYKASTWEHHEYGTQHEGPSWICADDAFQIEVEQYDDNEFNHGTATHWMPLPEPPL